MSVQTALGVDLCLAKPSETAGFFGGAMAMIGEGSGQTFAAAALELVEGGRDRIAQLPEFTNWLAKHRQVVVDDVAFFVVGGDMLKDQDEMMLYWARRSGLIDEQSILNLGAATEGEGELG
ncbi:MAG: hypothetical protein ABL889_01975 [Terricaulis sp.]